MHRKCCARTYACALTHVRLQLAAWKDETTRLKGLLKEKEGQAVTEAAQPDTEAIEKLEVGCAHCV